MSFPTLESATEKLAVSALIPAQYIPPSDTATIDGALNTLQANKQAWTSLDIQERIAIVDEIHRDLQAISDRWVETGMQAKQITPGGFGQSEQFTMLAVVFRVLRTLRRSLVDIQRFGRPRLPGRLSTRQNGQQVVPAFPLSWHDRVLMQGYRAEVWLPQNAELSQAAFYQDPDWPGRVTLILAAGNASLLPPADILYKLFIEGQVVIMKPNPVNEYWGPLIEQSFRALIDRGFLRVVYGGAQVGDYLVNHPSVDEIHLTGSDKTYEAIVFGTGEEGIERKTQRNPKISKPFSAELGNISPVIIVPGPWSENDFQAQAKKLATWLVSNASCNCLTPRVMIQWAGWQGRDELNNAIGEQLSNMDTRYAFYPGAAETHQRISAEYPNASKFGGLKPGHLPWTMIRDIDPNDSDNICFNQELFTTLFHETAIDAGDPIEFIRKAVAFANNQLWGTLTASIFVHPKSMRDPKIAAAVERAIEDLHYGSVVLNNGGVFAYITPTLPWGGYLGQDKYDIQSGIGVVNNFLMIDHTQKSVVYCPFVQKPDPMSATNPNVSGFAEKFLAYEISPSTGNFFGLLGAAMKSG